MNVSRSTTNIDVVSMIGTIVFKGGNALVGMWIGCVQVPVAYVL